jgi:predicted secreted protein
MNSSMKKIVVAGALLAASALASAQNAGVPVAVVAASPEGVLSLTSSATIQVPNDWIEVQFSISRDGTDSAAVQAALKAALATALDQANHVARPDGHVEVQGGGFSLQPRFDAKGRINGWTGSTQMSVQGRDMATIAALAGQVASMNVSSLEYSVSREAREKVEGDVTAQAIARFRAKAGDYAKAFGYAGFVVREVTVEADGGNSSPPRPMMMKAMAMSSDARMPIAAGSGSVTANVNGSVQLK